MPDNVKYLLPEDRIPRAWYNLVADLPKPPPPPLHPGTRQADRPGRPGAALPDGADRAGGLGRALDRDSRAGARHLPAVAADAALSRAPPGEGARYAGPHLLQVRRRQPAGQPQAEHRRAAGVLQQAKPASSGSPPRPAPGSGARRWPSPASSSASSARSTWSRSATSRSRTAGC